MLNIIYDYPEDMSNYVFGVPSFFDMCFENDWINHPLSREMIKDVDKSIVIQDRFIESPVLGLITPKDLSGGVKTLMCMLFMPEYVYGGYNCGDNCAKWILKIADVLEEQGKELTLSFHNSMNFPGPFKIRVLNDNSIVTRMTQLCVKLEEFYLDKKDDDDEEEEYDDEEEDEDEDEGEL